jgi:hypothetical protein
VAKKKYRIEGREEGRGKPFITRFDTLEQAYRYIADRWQGSEYIDGPAAFHTDYSTYELFGFELSDLGKRGWNAEYQYPTWDWHEQFRSLKNDDHEAQTG